MSNDREAPKYAVVLLMSAGLCALLAFSCGGLFYWGYGRMQEAEASAEAFLDRLAEGRLDEAYDRTSSAFQAAAGRERFAELLAKYPLVTSRSNRMRGPWKTRGTPQGVLVFLQYKLTGSGGSLPIEVIMIREGEWKVVSLNLP
jgi:hypothetical protein